MPEDNCPSIFASKIVAIVYLYFFLSEETLIMTWRDIATWIRCTISTRSGANRYEEYLGRAPTYQLLLIYMVYENLFLN